jgi:hypothetical protein
MRFEQFAQSRADKDAIEFALGQGVGQGGDSLAGGKVTIEQQMGLAAYFAQTANRSLKRLIAQVDGQFGRQFFEFLQDEGVFQVARPPGDRKRAVLNRYTGDGGFAVQAGVKTRHMETKKPG